MFIIVTEDHGDGDSKPQFRFTTGFRTHVRGVIRKKRWIKITATVVTGKQHMGSMREVTFSS